MRQPIDRDRSRTRRPTAVVGLALLLALPAAGCGGNESKPIEHQNQTVTGKVVLAGGRPLTKGRVALYPLKAPFIALYGKLGPDGVFTLSVGGFKAGVTYGEFQVSIEPEGFSSVTSKVKRPNPNFPAKYLDPAASGLTAKITPETTQLPTIELK
jgi:hypothetical protein